MILNNELTLDFPDSFRVLEEEEKKSMKFIAEGPGECLSDPSRKILLTVGWKKISKFASFMLNAGDVADKMEKSFASSMASFGYEMTGRPERTLDGEEAKGVSYRYTASETEMTGESYVMKHAGTLYYIHYYTRTALADENRSVFEDILASLKWS